MYRKILVATDGSTLSKKAVRSAIELAGAVGAELVALYVVPRYPISYFEGGVTVSTAGHRPHREAMGRPGPGRGRRRARSGAGRRA